MRFRFILLLCLTILAPDPAWSKIPNELELEYTEAVLAFNTKRYEEAEKKIDAMLGKSPGSTELLELKALVLKNTKNTPEAFKTYDALIAIKKKEGKPAKEIAPYHFELALMQFKDKKPQEARKNFEYSAKQDFNKSVCNFYLGLIAFQSSDWKAAADNFEALIKSSDRDLKPAAYFYLGQTYLKTDSSSSAMQNFIRAHQVAKDLLDDSDVNQDVKSVSQQIYNATDKVLEPFKKSQFFGTTGLMMGYNSNLQAIPSSVTNETTVSQKSSMKNSIFAGIGYMSSPLKRYQFVPSYKGDLAYIWNEKSRSTEFSNHTLALYINRDPLMRLSYGIKLEGTMVFKNNVTTPATSTQMKYEHYSTAGSFGPYAKYSITPKMTVGLDLVAQPQKYVVDGTGELRRSGMDLNARPYWQYMPGGRFFNPGIAFRFDFNNTQGKEYKSRSVAADLTNLMHLPLSVDLTAMMTYNMTTYSQRSSGKRNDDQLVLRAMGSRKLFKKWSVLASLDYTSNNSNLSTTYSYKQTVFNAGISYSF